MVPQYVSVDIETTGLDPDTCQVIEFGAVLETGSELPSFHAYIVHPLYQGEPYALSMHPTIFRRIATREPGFLYLRPEELGPRFAYWLQEQGLPPGKSIQAAGKNFGSFDLQFLKRIHRFEEFVRIAHRSYDPAMLYFQPGVDSKLPDMKTCMQRAGIEGEVTHTAVEDARLVVQLLRKAWQHDSE